MTESLTYLQLVEALTALVNNKASGTMFIRSQCNHAITFTLDAGRIYAVHHGPRRGLSAIPLIGQIAGGSYRFDAAGPGRPPQELPSTAEILERLKTPQGTIEAPANASPADENDAVSAEQKHRICHELKNLLMAHLGPIAEMVFDDTVDEKGDFCSTSERTQELIAKLASDIGDPAEIIQFREDAYRMVSKILGS
jgi:hypothetical protein